MSVSDLYKMKDVVEIIDRGGTGRMVRLVPGICPSPVPAELNPNQTTEQVEDLLIYSCSHKFCKRYFRDDQIRKCIIQKK